MMSVSKGLLAPFEGLAFESEWHALMPEWSKDYVEK